MEFRWNNKSIGEMVEEHEEYLVFSNHNFRLTGPDVYELTPDLPLLYKRDAKGEWQTMEIWLQCGGKAPSIRSSIRIPGKKTRNFSSPIKPVASKHYSFTVREKLQSKWNKKHDRDGWVGDKDAPEPLKEPQLLHHFDQYAEKMEYPAILSGKMNGIRATYRPDMMRIYSRKRNEFNLPHIEKELAMLGMTVDGELWHPEWDLETISGTVKRGGISKLQFWLFDSPSSDSSYPARMKKLIEKVDAMNFRYVRVVAMAVVGDEEEAVAGFNFLKKEKGLDGAVLRAITQPYKWDTRSYDVLKMKDLIHHEFKCCSMSHDVDEIGDLAKFVFETDDGQTFLYVPNRTKEERKKMYEKYTKNPSDYEGHIYTLEFREWTTKGKPRHILGMTERNYE